METHTTPKQFLYEQLDSVSSMGFLKKEVPDCVGQNLNPKYELRPYQVEAFARFFYSYKNDFPNKKYPLHLLFNMATGSGKTLIMAGLILYLYEQGYRDFLFFVNSTNIIEKTKDNFLNPASIKYLFNREIHVDNRRVSVSPVGNFEGVNPGDINICFTTIQKLHSDLTTERENAITYEDFRKHKVVLIADEAHHINVKTKSEMEMFESWENTVEDIFTQNEDNLLLEFTATHDYETRAMVDKYRNKVIIRYDLRQFRNERYSKDVVIIHSDLQQDGRILQALILSQYKQEVAAKYRINLKPVILFKAQHTVEQSRQNKANFHRIIENLSAKDITALRRASDIPLIRRAFAFFDAQDITAAQLAKRLKREFQPDYCLSVNNDIETQRDQIRLNTLEDKTNRTRAIFAVQKLNEGWDVLNLFDIVRCYEVRDSGHNRIGATTMSEAQLIGRGARYFPFALPGNDDLFRRKFDRDLNHELRVLEELDYHSINDSRYVAEIQSALVDQGMMDQQEVTRELRLKELFKRTDFYQHGVVWFNLRRPSDFHDVQSLSDLGVKRRNYVHHIATGHGGSTVALDNDRNGTVSSEEARRDIRVKEIECNIVQSALARNPFFTFVSLKRLFPNLASMQDFVASEDYLGGLQITFSGNLDGLEENRIEKLSAVQGLLMQLEAKIRQQVTDYQGTEEFHPAGVKEVFKNKTLKFTPSNLRAAEDQDFDHFVSSKDWFAFNTIFGTSEEKSLVHVLDGEMQKLGTRYDEIYLVRNEGHFSIYNFSDGQAFQPDFVLFLRKKDGDLLGYQLFIEPKGAHLIEHDSWKETFLEEIAKRFKGERLILGDKYYRLIGLPFYNSQDENRFKASLESALDQTEPAG
ncbi:DEAD/DEAH box helicase family protein [Candidatus Cryosericum septentrionale]|jgi:type III restriction enzyme|uniref:Type III deoxyribonuclease n=1 Tax=Candidatus Cryosericum septentrionale TaxID=2290913 RepID=A0A398DPX7_9BACT|nr:DEAD/DEAH box helicase family protein [Candidatus Cryosericum septentrionale]RIE17692.1 type III deoxyribonuclease [Candidatus Cryosericum septentrionale]